jgi:hypothetical protein
MIIYIYMWTLLNDTYSIFPFFPFTSSNLLQASRQVTAAELTSVYWAALSLARGSSKETGSIH